MTTHQAEAKANRTVTGWQAEAFRKLDKAMRVFDLIAYQAEETHIRLKAEEAAKEIRKFLSP